MAKDQTKIKECRACGSKRLAFLFSLGVQPLTGVFVKPEEPDPLRAPLDLVICEECKLVQLAHTVKSGLMYENYWYRSGINRTMREHLAGIVGDIDSRTKLEAGDVIVDIGCNDGTLLAAYNVEGLIKIGVDPSNAIDLIDDAEIVKVKGLFSKDSLMAALKGRRAKVITAISMFYDIGDPHEFVQNIADVLDTDGIWIVEMNYTGDMIRHCGYDMISHEHLMYYTMTVFEKMILEHRLHINDVSLNSINGGSIRIFVGLRPGGTKNVDALREKERAQGLDKNETYLRFGNRMEKSRNSLTSKVKDIIGAGGKIAVYGASTRGNTILLYCGLDREVIFGAAERNPIKYGLVTAGTRIPIKAEAEIRAAKPDYLLILPYGFLNEFLEREADYLEAGGRFLVPIPQLVEIYMKDGRLIRQLVRK